MTTKQRYVVLVSGEDQEFTITREAAEHSRTLRDMLQASAAVSGSAGGEEEVPPKFKLDDIPSNVLDLVCQYLAEKQSANNTMSEFKQLKSLDPKNDEDRQLVLELLLAADYLDC